MTEAVAASILQLVADAVVKQGAAAAKRQCSYLCCFSSNINGLKEESRKLDDSIKGLQARVEAATNNVEDIVPEVMSWLSESNNFKAKTNEILDRVSTVQNFCLGVTTRFSLSRNAKKTTEAMKEQRERCNFDVVSLPQRAAASKAIPLGKTYEFESRKQIEGDIIKILRDGDVKMIGIHGMGGLGKTTMAKRIMNMALNENLFEEVLIVVVSQQVDESRIQLEIGGTLGMKDLEKDTPQARVQKLHERLSDKKKTLLVLDDVWKSLDLVELGIPCDSEGCRILFTSRNSDALKRMDVEMVFGMEILSKEGEAWLLFRENTGSCVDDKQLKSIAEEVVKECRGLPIALVTVGAAMKDEKDKHIWKDALKQLRKGNPKNIPNFIAQVYNPLKISYNKLESEEAKSVFLLCCLFPEDANIPLTQLTYFCMGLRIFEEMESLEEARNEMRTLIKILKSRSLLLDDWDEDYVRMHDVVRDVCIFIAKEEGYIGGNDCTWISSFISGNLQTGLGFPKVNLLSLEKQEMEININTFFEGMRDLYVLSVNGYSWTSLQHTTQLKNLKTLILDSCRDLETISVVGDLVNLEILTFHHCNRIKELPRGIGRLNRLKLLDLTGCINLQRIRRGIISSLVGLEELKMLESFNRWEASDSKVRRNAELKELELLTNLTCLEIQIENLVLAAEKMHLPSNIEIFHIRIQHTRSMFDGFIRNFYMDEICYNKTLSLHWQKGICLGDWIQMQLLRDTQSLFLSGPGVNNVELANNYPSLFTNLSSIKIEKCHRLHNLGQLPIAGKVCLPHLESLTIKNCRVMEQVFLSNQQEPSRHLTKVIPKLERVILRFLPNLTAFYEGIEGIEFPLLKKMDVYQCPKMTKNNSGGTSSVDVDDDRSSHLFCQPQKEEENKEEKEEEDEEYQRM